jgi:hypothetical protein
VIRFVNSIEQSHLCGLCLIGVCKYIHIWKSFDSEQDQTIIKALFVVYHFKRAHPCSFLRVGEEKLNVQLLFAVCKLQ